MNFDLISGKECKRRTVLLYSGGMDSYIISKLERFDTLLFIDSKSKYSHIEREFLKKQHIKNLIIDERLDLSDVEYKSAMVPLRNLFFVAIGSYYGDRIVLGATSGDRSFDKDLTFASKLQDLLSYVYNKSWWSDGREINVDLRYKEYTKKRLIDEYVEKGFSIGDLVEKSFSCYSPIDNHSCGTCKPCTRKWLNLLPYENTKMTFHHNPEEYWKEKIKDIKKNLGDKILSRGKEDEEAVEIWEKYKGGEV